MNTDFYPTKKQKEVCDVFYAAGYSKPVFDDNYVAKVSKLIGRGTRHELKIDKNGKII